jgi:amino acid transporter
VKSGRSLGLVGAVALSLALVSPSMAVSLNPQAMATQVGSAVPTMFLAALIPVSVVALAFAVLSSKFGSRGSIFGLVTASIGPRAGTAAGLLLLLTYLLVVPIYVAGFGIGIDALGTQFGWSMSGRPLMLLCGLLALALAFVMAQRSLGRVGHLLLILEGATIAVVLFVCGVTLFTLVTSGGPTGQRVDFAALSPSGLSASAIGLGLTFAVLSVAGFEGAAATAESTRNPLRNVPRAIVFAAIFSTLFYLVVSAVGVWAFGTAPNQLMAFTQSPSLPAAIADDYVADGVGTFLVIGLLASSFAGMIGGIVACARILATFSRAGVVPARLSKVAGDGAPLRASTVVLVLGLIITAVVNLLFPSDEFGPFNFLGGIAGTLFMLAYGAVCAGATVVLWRTRHRGWAGLTAAGVVVVIGVIAMTTFPLPTGVDRFVPVVALAALAVSVVIGLAKGRRAGEVLSEENAEDGSVGP